MVAYYRRFTGESCIAEFTTEYQSYIANPKFCIANCDAIPLNSCLGKLDKNDHFQLWTALRRNRTARHVTGLVRLPHIQLCYCISQYNHHYFPSKIKVLVFVSTHPWMGQQSRIWRCLNKCYCYYISQYHKGRIDVARNRHADRSQIHKTMVMFCQTCWQRVRQTRPWLCSVRHTDSESDIQDHDYVLSDMLTVSQTHKTMIMYCQTCWQWVRHTRPWLCTVRHADSESDT